MSESEKIDVATDHPLWPVYERLTDLAAEFEPDADGAITFPSLEYVRDALQGMVERIEPHLAEFPDLFDEEELREQEETETPPELEAFNRAFGATLALELTEKPQPMAGILLNLVASPTAKLLGVSWKDVQVRPEPAGPTEEDWGRIALEAQRLTLAVGPRDKRELVEYSAQDERGFTARQLLDCVLDSQRYGRPRTDWFGGIDVHHIYFEGVWPRTDGTYVVSWGS